MRRLGPGGPGPARSWSPAYLADNAELDYAGNTHVGQGRTVDTADLLWSPARSPAVPLYVGPTRGRNRTPRTSSPGKRRHRRPPYQQAALESVVKAIMDGYDTDVGY